MSDIGPGDWVEFVGKPDGYTNPHFSEVPLVIGAVYRVTEVGRQCEDGAGRPWPSLRVAGFPVVSPRGRPASVPVAAFRPIYRPRADIIEQLKQPSPELQPA